jgi:hypothetical protein
MPLKFTDEYVKGLFENHPEVDMSGLAYIYAYEDRGTASFGPMKSKYYFLGWDAGKLHVLETSMTGKEKSFRSLSTEEIENVEIKNRIINTLVIIKLKGGDKYKLNCNKKVMGLKNQKEHLEKLLQILNPMT